jgi:hypothetical protein
VAAREDLQWIDLTDFTRGVSSTYHSVSAENPQPDGFAREGETYGCYGLVNGGLAPLPAITFNRAAGDPATGYTGQKWPTVADGYPEGYDRRIAVLDAKVVSPVTYSPALEAEVDPGDDPVDLFTVRQWYMVNTADTKVDSIWRFRGHPVWSGVTTNAFGVRDFHAWEVAGYDDWNPHPSRWTYGWGSLMETRTQSPDGDKQRAGSPVIVFGMGGILELSDQPGPGTLSEGVEIGGFYTYPDYKVTNEFGFAVPYDRTTKITVPLNALSAGMVFGHQGRVCSVSRPSALLFQRLLAYHGDDFGVRAGSDLIAYWPVNDAYLDGNPNLTTFLEEAATGFGTWSSVNANSLFLVKNKGGAVLVNGDIASPQVVRLPGVPSVGGVANRGAVTAAGYVYGTVSGVWLWAGGDVAEELSPQLRPRFWVPDDPTIARRAEGQLLGSFAYRHPFLFAPNNWCMDMRTGGWFRYHPTPEQDADNGTIFAYNETDSLGNLWAIVASYELDGRFYSKFDQDSQASKFVWRSQPLTRTRNRMLTYRSVNIVASGVGRVTVDVIGLDQAPQRVEVDVDSVEAQSAEVPVSVQTKDVEVRITSEAGTPGDPAPVVHRVSLGHVARQSIGRLP